MTSWPRTVFLLLLLSNLFLFLNADEKGKLKEFEQSLSEKSQEQEDPGIEQEKSEEEDEECFLSRFFYDLLYHFYIGVPARDPEKTEFLLGKCLTQYPYADYSAGNYSSQGTRKLKLILQSYYFHHNKNLTGYGLKSKLFLTPYLNLEMNYCVYREELGSRKEEMDAAGFFLDYQRFREEHFNWWWGVGVKVIKGREYHTGFGFSSGLDVFFFKPLSVSFSVDQTWIETSPVTEISGVLNLHLKMLFIYTGYQTLQTRSVVLDGPVVGLGLNF